MPWALFESISSAQVILLSGVVWLCECDHQEKRNSGGRDHRVLEVSPTSHATLAPGPTFQVQ